MFHFCGSFYVDMYVVMWTEGLTVTIKWHFQIYPAQYGQRLRATDITLLDLLSCCTDG